MAVHDPLTPASALAAVLAASLLVPSKGPLGVVGGVSDPRRVSTEGAARFDRMLRRPGAGRASSSHRHVSPHLQSLRAGGPCARPSVSFLVQKGVSGPRFTAVNRTELSLVFFFFFLIDECVTIDRYSDDLSIVQFSRSVVSQLCDPMDCSTPGFPVHRQLSEFAQTRVHQLDDAIQPSYPLSSPSPAFNLS